MDEPALQTSPDRVSEKAPAALAGGGEAEALLAPLVARLDALQASIDGPAPDAGAGGDERRELDRMAAELGQMGRMVALGDDDRQRLADLHRMMQQGNAGTLTQQVEAMHRELRRISGSDPELSNPAWHRDRVARRNAENEVRRLQGEMARMARLMARQQAALDAERKSRRKQARPAGPAGSLRQWFRTAPSMAPLRRLYRRLRGL